jgi:hypothetical protein
MKSVVLGLVALLAFACSAPETSSDTETVTVPSTTEVARTVPALQEERCGLALTVADHELVTAATSASVRWSAATGCDVRVVPTGGLPIRFATDAELTMPDGSRARGVTGDGFIGYTARDARLPGTVERTLAHEIGHALGCRDHTHEAGSSVLDEQWGAHARITADALVCVCTTVACEHMIPESTTAM